MTDYRSIARKAGVSAEAVARRQRIARGRCPECGRDDYDRKREGKRCAVCPDADAPTMRDQRYYHIDRSDHGEY